MSPLHYCFPGARPARRRSWLAAARQVGPFLDSATSVMVMAGSSIRRRRRPMLRWVPPQPQPQQQHPHQQRRGMMALPPTVQARLERLTERHARILEEMNHNNSSSSSSSEGCGGAHNSSSSSSSSHNKNLGRELASLSTAAALRSEQAALDGEEASFQELLREAAAGTADDGDGDELREECRAELERVAQRRAALEARIVDAVLPGSDDGDGDGTASAGGDAILEVRAGTGGDEAALFGAELLASYLQTCRELQWKTEILQQSRTELGGLREASVLIRGRPAEIEVPALAMATATATTTQDEDSADSRKTDSAPAESDATSTTTTLLLGPYGAFQYESGVHRVQRVPVNDTRIHTSACSVAVLPSLDAETDREQALPPEELKVETMRSSGAGGQHVNTTDSAVRITHLPTGLTASIQDERSQHQNRVKAVRLLTARVRDRQRAEALAERGAARSALLGGGDRSERIRTFNFPQDRVTDHRARESRHGIAALLRGGRGDGLALAFLPPLRQLRRREQLRQLEEEEEEKREENKPRRKAASGGKAAS